MSKTLLLLICFSLFQGLVVSASETAPSLYTEARQAIAEGIPEVGIQKLKQYLEGSIPAEARSEATLKLAKALFETGNPEQALLVLDRENPSPNQSASPITGSEALFLKAQIFSALGRWNEAIPLFHSLSSDPQLTVLGKQGEAEALYALDRLPEAVALLESIKDEGSEIKLRLADFYFETQNLKQCEAILASVSPTMPSAVQWKKYITGRLLLVGDQPEAALAKFDEIIKDPQGVSENLMVGAILGITGARIAQLGGAEAAGHGLEDFIRLHPDSRYLDLLFKRLDQIYANQENTTTGELLKWSQNPPQRRKALSQFYLGKMEGRAKKPEKALADWSEFTREFPEHPLVAQAFLLQGTVLMELNKIEEALTAFEASMRKAPDGEALAEAEIAAGRAHFKQREFLLAANMFKSAASHSERLWQTAIYNSALAWLNLGNYDKFIADYKLLSAKFPNGKYRRELLLEEGLIQARSGDPRAKGSLQLFIHDFPNHSRVGEAQLALAELSFLSSDIPGASLYLKAVNTTPQSIETSDQAEYLALFLADAAEPRDEVKLINDCQTFIRERKNSVQLPDVRMKLGQIYFRREDFANAQTQFELLASESQGTPYAEMALYLAGKSAAQSMNPNATERALDLFEQVKKLNGSLKLYALQQEALIKSRPGLESEAIILYDNILGSNPEPDLKFSALCGKGNNYLSLGNSDPKRLDQAISVFDLLDRDPGVTPFWRNQALYKKGKCLEKQNKTSEALTVFYDVLASQSGTEPDYFWYYKAGFDAAKMLEAGEQWKSAIGIYKKMAGVNGPRAKEAGDRARQLRMEHFIWEE